MLICSAVLCPSMLQDAGAAAKAALAGAAGNFLQVKDGRFIDDRWVGGRWDLSQFPKDKNGETDWDTVRQGMSGGQGSLGVWWEGGGGERRAGVSRGMVRREGRKGGQGGEEGKGGGRREGKKREGEVEREAGGMWTAFAAARRRQNT